MTLPELTEKQFHALVVELATTFGWRHYHTHDSRRSDHGWPDLVLVRERVIYAELKTSKGRLSAHQEAWVTALEEAGQEVYVWRPTSLQTIPQILAYRAQKEAA